MRSLVEHHGYAEVGMRRLASEMTFVFQKKGQVQCSLRGVYEWSRNISVFFLTSRIQITNEMRKNSFNSESKFMSSQ